MLTINLSGIGCPEELEDWVKLYLNGQGVTWWCKVEHAINDRHLHFLCMNCSPGLKGNLKGRFLGTEKKPIKKKPFDYITHDNWFKGFDCVTWHMNPEFQEGYTPPYNRKYDHGLAYCTKDGPLDDSNTELDPFSKEVQDCLVRNKTEEERRKPKVWPQMDKWVDMFRLYDLPHKTWEEVDMSVTNLAFKRKVMMPPKARDWKELCANIHMYMNDYEGSYWSYMEQLNNGHMLKRKQDLLDQNSHLEERVIEKRRKICNNLAEEVGEKKEETLEGPTSKLKCSWNK